VPAGPLVPAAAGQRSPTTTHLLAKLTLTTALTLLLGLAWTTPAHATTPTTIWVDSSARILFDNLTITTNTFGFRAKNSSDVTVQHSLLTANKAAGVMELGGVTRGRYLHDDITNNGHDGQPYNGDGLQLDGTGALISDCDITGNGDNTLYEHGIYASTTALDYTIDNNRFSGNSATNVKAEGSGTVHANQFGSARLGMYVDQTPPPA
jgi:hypothetical protein